MLFFEEGINATGIEKITEVANVSRRTFYQHFPSKAALIAEYLQRFEEEILLALEPGLTRADLSPRDRLLSIFADNAPLRGCPLHNAAVEIADRLPAVSEIILQHKRAFAELLTEIAREAGAVDPEALGRQLTVLYEGAKALSTSLGSQHPTADARQAAAALIDALT